MPVIKKTKDKTVQPSLSDKCFFQRNNGFIFFQNLQQRLFLKGFMALMNLIEYIDEDGNEMVHRIPEQGSGEFQIGSQLIVRESQWAVFFRDGKAYDVFSAGRHTLTTLNIPLITAILTAPLYGDSPFRAEAYFVSQRTFTDLKWGTVEPILFRDSEFKMIRLRSNGIYTFQITDPSCSWSRSWVPGASSPTVRSRTSCGHHRRPAGGHARREPGLSTRSAALLR